MRCRVRTGRTAGSSSSSTRTRSRSRSRTCGRGSRSSRAIAPTGAGSRRRGSSSGRSCVQACPRSSHPERVGARAALIALVGLVALIGSGAASPAPSAREIRVPEDAATLQLAVGRAAPGDTIVLSAGTYPGGVVVPPQKHDLTIRGVDRNAVVLDGANRRKNGIVVHADGVSVLNLSAHDFTKNGLYWDGADRFRASYVTVWNVGEYGVYVEDGEHGRVDHAYVSGAARAAYYVGECGPCDATISDVVARLSAIGYSGTNATGLVIRDSLWARTGAGLRPHTLAAG